GIEEFIGLLKSISNSLELHLLGNIDLKYQEFLISAMPGWHSLFFHALVSEKELPGKITNFDIGLALELVEPPSRNYTITNKFFQYLQAGLPVIATETAGQKEAFEKFNPGFMIPQNPATGHIKKLKNWLNDPLALHNAKSVANTAAVFYSWENESKKLLNLINNEFGPQS
ncbi:MAG: glycosyl transferase, group 1, partial [Mucilaginibacter sp.]|nr:glycosyl transferase, group 1 [Mucilaginibacter sp.]